LKAPIVLDGIARNEHGGLAIYGLASRNTVCIWRCIMTELRDLYATIHQHVWTVSSYGVEWCESCRTCKVDL
jgi:hypothetical protein